MLRLKLRISISDRWDEYLPNPVGTFLEGVRSRRCWNDCALFRFPSLAPLAVLALQLPAVSF